LTEYVLHSIALALTAAAAAALSSQTQKISVNWYPANECWRWDRNTGRLSYTSKVTRTQKTISKTDSSPLTAACWNVKSNSNSESNSIRRPLQLQLSPLRHKKYPSIDIRQMNVEDEIEIGRLSYTSKVTRTQKTISKTDLRASKWLPRSQKQCWIKLYVTVGPKC
jgi:hypothetical protein